MGIVVGPQDSTTPIARAFGCADKQSMQILPRREGRRLMAKTARPALSQPQTVAQARAGQCFRTEA